MHMCRLTCTVARVCSNCPKIFNLIFAAMTRLLVFLLLLASSVTALRLGQVLRATVVAVGVGSLSNPQVGVAKSEETIVPLSRYFDAVRRELDPKEGVSLLRIKKDIDEGNWEDLKAFTREYDAGFRGGVLKSTWKQLGDKKKRGIEVSNSFTFDLIGLNKAARKGDAADALKYYEVVRQDIKDFLSLEPNESK